MSTSSSGIHSLEHRDSPGRLEIELSDVRLRLSEIHTGDMRDESGYFCRFFHGGTLCGEVDVHIVRNDGSHDPNQRPIVLNSLVCESDVSSRKIRVGSCALGVMVFCHSRNSNRQQCIKFVGSATFDSVPLFGGCHSDSSVLFSSSVCLHPLVLEVDLRRATRGCLSFKARCIFVDKSLLVVDPRFPFSAALTNEYNNGPLHCYIKRFYDCNRLCLKPTVKKLACYFVPYFVTTSGARLPASAYLAYSLRHSFADTSFTLKRDNSDTLISRIWSALAASVDCYPELKSVGNTISLIEQMILPSRPRQLSCLQYSALRAVFEILVQKCVSEPYLSDHDVDSISKRLVDDDVFISSSETVSTDCEDGATSAFSLFHLIRTTDWVRLSSVCSIRYRGIALRFSQSIAPLLSMFTGFVAIMYCNDSAREDTTVDRGFCHVAFMAVTNSAADALVGTGTSPIRRVSKSSSLNGRWEDTIGLIIPESTSLTDSLLTPLTADAEIERLARHAAEVDFSEYISRYECRMPSCTVMFSGSFTTPKSTNHKDGRYASGFYQWIVNLWTVDYQASTDGSPVLDIVPCYSDASGRPTTTGVSVDDLCAQCCSNGFSREVLVSYFGEQLIERISTSPVVFYPRVTGKVCETAVAVCNAVIDNHIAPYVLFPGPCNTYDDCLLGKSGVIRKMLTKSVSNENVKRALLAKIENPSVYVRSYAYALDLQKNAWGVHGAKTIMESMDSVFSQPLSPGKNRFYALRIMVSDIYPGLSASKVSFIAFYRPSSTTSSVRDLLRTTDPCSIPGQFSSSSAR